MSYKSFKRVLGETSLERKCRFLFGACLLLLITSSFWWYGKRTESLVYEQNLTKGRLIVDTILTREHWEALELNEDFKTTVIGGFSSTLQAQEYDYWFINPNRLEDATPLDEFERDFLRVTARAPAPERSEGEQRPRVTWRFVNGSQQYEYYQAIYAGTSCVDCHRTMTGPTDMADGDLMAVAKVRVSNAPTLADLHKNRALLLATAIITVFLAMVASYVIVRYVIVKPLKHLRDVSDAVSHGDINQRAEIQTADEFEELGVAFNRMLRHLVTTQEELRQANSNLDLKVDELAQANMRLFEANRLKGDFLATMSHELRTPLNSILGFSDVLSGSNQLGDKQQRYVHNIQQSGKMLLDMINDILDLAKIESGKMEVRPIDFRIEQVIHQQCDLARPLAEKKNIDLLIDVPRGGSEMRQDQGKVQQILNNLLSNAIKFTPEGGRINVSAHHTADETLELVVADTGVGIAEEDQTAIFEKFRQGRTVMGGGGAMTREYSGTGLGLSIVKELCKLLGGEIGLESELGRGSTFTVRLPWILADQPRRESALSDTIDELTRPRRVDFDPALDNSLRT